MHNNWHLFVLTIFTGFHGLYRPLVGASGPSGTARSHRQRPGGFAHLSRFFRAIHANALGKLP